MKPKKTHLWLLAGIAIGLPFIVVLAQEAAQIFIGGTEELVGSIYGGAT
jgi:hypothetical protein